jgi:ATP-binding cassette subfamily C protein CydD
VAAAQRIFEVLEVEAEAEVGPSPNLNLNLNLNFSDVYYAYDDGRRPALRGVTFGVSPGQKVALVGPSGAGKSTVAYLFLRFIEPDQGDILVDGRPLRELPRWAWREQVAWVPQNPYLFHGTVAENIRLGRPDAGPGEVAWAARQAHAQTFVESLPQGYNTVIGERGARLSDGQAQRLALARAFLKDVPFLILDEATANLDPEIEDLVQEAMSRLLVGRTALIIAHRLSTVRGADRILVMAEGQIQEEGTHSELVRQNGLYRQLVTAHSRATFPGGGAV